MKTQTSAPTQYSLNPNLGYQIGLIFLGFGLAFGGMLYGSNDGINYLFPIVLVGLSAFMVMQARIKIRASVTGLSLAAPPRADSSPKVKIVESLNWNDSIEYAIRTDRGDEVFSWTFVEDLTFGFARVPYLFLYSNEGLLLRTLSTSGDFEILLHDIDAAHLNASQSSSDFSLCIANAKRSEIKLCKVKVRDKIISLEVDPGKNSETVSGLAYQFRIFSPTADYARGGGLAQIQFDGKIVIDQVLCGSALKKFELAIQ